MSKFDYQITLVGRLVDVYYQTLANEGTTAKQIVAFLNSNPTGQQITLRQCQRACRALHRLGYLAKSFDGWRAVPRPTTFDELGNAIAYADQSWRIEFDYDLLSVAREENHSTIRNRNRFLDSLLGYVVN